MADILSTVTNADLETIAGGTLLVSATLPATDDEAGYAALTFTEIGGVSDLPAVGGSSNTVTYDLLSTGFTSKLKGQRQFGAGTVNYATVLSDAGQIIMDGAEASKDSYAFKILYTTGEIIYVTGKVMGNPVNNGAADTVKATTAAIEWVTTPVKVAAP